MLQGLMLSAALAEMDPIEMSYNEDCIADSTAEVLVPSEYEHANNYNVFGETEVLPRVGEEYQAEIPALVSQPNFTHLGLDIIEDSITRYGSHDFHIGLPVPVMWIPLQHGNIKHGKQEFSSGICGSSNKTDGLKLDNKVKLEELGKSVLVDVDRQTFRRCTQEDCFLVPGSLYNVWSEQEEENFLLGLYIFGKNLIQVKKFIENKSMGEILSFYYGKFYGSAKYGRWSMCRKMKSRRCVYGQKIFTGLRQQELLSRLLPQVSEESQSKLMETSKSFGDGKASLEEYVFTLKAIVGLRALVQAIGIGKGKQDLTGVGNDHTKPSNQAVPLSSEIPVGKACSVLTPAEIVTFLTGNFRLSKARSNDLFWEAVWPRLLARGWHSEQPENRTFMGSRHSLVFLVPGVKKYSKRRHVKGDHYFDSVSDVLNKVASQPGLLDLDAQPDIQGGFMSREGGENQWENEHKSDQEDSSDEERHCYLKPRSTLPQSGEDIKFTIVDTSMAVDGIANKLRELRGLPHDISWSIFRTHFEEDNGEVGSNSGADSSNLSMEDADVSKFVKVNDEGKRTSSQPKEMEYIEFSSRNHKKVLEFQPRQRVKAENKKHQKLGISNCSLRSSSGNEVSLGVRIDQELVSCCSSDPLKVEDRNRNILQVGPSPETLSSTNSPSKDVTTVNSGHDPGNLNEPWTVIDLNLPIYPDPEFTPDQGLQTDAQSDAQGKLPVHDPDARGNPSHVVSTGQQPNIGRRQSRRSRPPTIKALEALAFGLFDTKRKRKNREGLPREISQHPPRQGPRTRPDDGSYSTGFVGLSEEDKGSNDKVSESVFSQKLSGFSL
ncbi:hypothetical protein SAY86_022247 [Trapa natans]|uniref:SANT domain-containing protein n=1 Tax=Trapa natans TaxID=22666 RepID=A0AAN7MTN8_TRANT|nr:hypothetical protein SAY86_022247 [Trapa natans]